MKYMIDAPIFPTQTLSLRRRDFMLALVAGMTSVALMPSTARATPVFDRSQLTGLRLAAFRALAGERFGLQREQVRSEVELVTIEEQTAQWVRAGSPAPAECFLLTFRDVGCCGLTQGSYTFQHRVYGQFELFIVPSPSHAHEYIATINHLYA